MKIWLICSLFIFIGVCYSSDEFPPELSPSIDRHTSIVTDYVGPARPSSTDTIIVPHSLISLEEARKRKSKEFTLFSTDWVKNGITCPVCGEEMETDVTTTYLTNPPTQDIRCPKCGYKDTF